MSLYGTKTLIVLYLLHFRGPPRRDKHPSSVSYIPDFAIISGFSITVYVGARPLSSRKAMMCLRTPIIFAAMPTQLSLCAISVSSKSCATCKSSFVAISDFPARKIGSCISSLTILHLQIGICQYYNCLISLAIIATVFALVSILMVLSA